MKKSFLKTLKLLMLYLPVSIFAQELPEIIPPSPTVANLMKFEEIPISYYTGQPNISIPIYSKTINGALAMNISLSYNTQGVKINNVSGWTGTSWSLMAGGSISRTVRGEPDEINKDYGTNKVGILHNPDYWNYDNLSLEEKAKFNFKVIGDSMDKYDNQPDLYQFNFMGYSGRFIILKNGTTLEPHFISKSVNFKLDFNYTNDYEITAFTITDPNGYIYTFNVVETSKTSSFVGSKAQGVGSTFNVSAGPSNFFSNSAWHLSKVEKSNGSELITLTYQDSFETYAVTVNKTTSKIINTNQGYSFNTITSNSYNQSILEPLESVSYQNITSTTKKLDIITFVQDSTQVHFNMDMDYTHPETNGKTLKSIEIKNGTNINKTYTLTYEETLDDSLNPIELKRLWLTKITESAGSISLDYNLYYYDKENLPGFNKEDIRGDAWGYFSGINTSTLNCTGISYDESLIQTGLLHSIEYPTGGVKEFKFEHNSYSYFQNQTIPYIDYIKNPRNTNLKTKFKNNFIYNHTGQSAPTETIDSFTLDFDQDIYISSWMDASPYLEDHIIKIYNNTYEVYVELDLACTKITNVPAGDYTIALAPYNNLNNTSYTISGDFQVVYTDAIPQLKQEMIGGGVRIKSITFRNEPLSQKKEKHLKFIYDDETNSSLSSGIIDTKVDLLEHNYVKNTDRFLFGNSENVCHSLIPQSIDYEVSSKSVNAELTQGSYVGYRHVKVLEENNGYKTFSYTSPFNYPTTYGTLPFEQPLPKANLDYKRGLLLKEKIFNQSNQILKEVSYLDNNDNPNYLFDEEFLFIDKNIFRPNCMYLQFFTDWTFYNNGTIQNQPQPCPILNFGNRPCGEFPHTQVDFKSGWAKLLGTTTKEYFYDANNNQTFTETRQEFQYNPNNYQIASQKTSYNKSGVQENIEIKYFYPIGSNLASNTPTIINKLIDLNKVNEVLETQTYKNGVKINEKHTIYNEFHTDIILPKEVKISKENETPTTRIKFKDYDNHGNILQVSKTDGMDICYIYGYGKTLPVAKIENATYSQVSTYVSNIQNKSNLDNDNCQDSGSCNEKNLRTALNALRTGLPNAMVTTYTYDPLIGVTSITDPKGYTVYYEYDDLNRLVRVKDADGKIMSENKYHYLLDN
jgi:hypothetical protein